MGRDIRFDLGRIDGYKNFCNKIWNAARYVQMNLENVDRAALQPGMEYSVADRWIRSRLGATIETVRAQLAEYRFDLAAQALYEFAWYEYCDWYLELSKPTLQSDRRREAQKRGDAPHARRSARSLSAAAASADAVHHGRNLAGARARSQASTTPGPTIMLQPYPKRDGVRAR